MFICVEVGIEDVEDEAGKKRRMGIRHYFGDLLQDNRPGHGVQPDDDSNENKELSVR